MPKRFVPGPVFGAATDSGNYVSVYRSHRLGGVYCTLHRTYTQPKRGGGRSRASERRRTTVSPSERRIRAPRARPRGQRSITSHLQTPPKPKLLVRSYVPFGFLPWAKIDECPCHVLHLLRFACRRIRKRENVIIGFVGNCILTILECIEILGSGKELLDVKCVQSAPMSTEYVCDS